MNDIKPVRQTSLMAYYEVLKEVKGRRLEVLKAINEIEPCNNMMISKHLHLPINSITGRTNELKHMKLIYESHIGICPFTKKSTIFYRRIKK